MANVARWAKEGSIAVVQIDNPPLNVLSTPVRAGVLQALRQAVEDANVEAVLLHCARRTFCAGSDLTEFERPPEAPTLPELTSALEQSSKPVVVALHGTVFGGGFELALACHYRIAQRDTKVGLPEITLGMMPGCGGSQRLPRLIGVARALQMITSGDPVSAADAAAWGAIDEIVQEDLIGAGLDAARRFLSREIRIRRTADIPFPPLDEDLFGPAEQAALRKRRSAAAVRSCLQAIRAGAELPFEDAVRRERELFLALRVSPEAASRRYVFLAEREAARSPWIAPGTTTREIRKAGIVGAGNMGSGIATCFANAGIPVVLLEADPAALERGMAIVRKRVEGAAAELVRPSLDYCELGDADIVIEATFEDLAVKRAVFEQIDAHAKAGAILTTNTSYLDVSRIAAFTRRPKDVVGTHFFSPAYLMKLLECVCTPTTSQEVLATVMKLGRTLSKTTVLAGDGPGFIGNRMLARRTREAYLLLEDGALPQQVDQAFVEFGFPMGPFAVSDLSGLDIFWRARKMVPALRPAGKRDSRLLETLCDLGRLGQKTSAGWYRYEPGNRTPIPDPAVEELILRISDENRIERRIISNAEIVERCLYSMINEGARILEEGIAARALDIDIVWVNGYGFPVERGGPMRYADSVGLDAILERILSWSWEAAPLLTDLAREHRRFSDWSR